MPCRFIYDNLITAESMFTVSSLRNGLVSDAKKDGTGSATLTPAGNFTGTTDLEYIVEIDSVAAGAEVASATFKWTSAYADGWNATGVATATTDTSLNNGVTIRFASGTGDDFALGDRWYFKGVNLFNAGKMIDLDRDTRYRSAALGSPNTIIVDLGSAQEVKALVLYDHNFTSNVTLTLEGHTADAWGAPDFQESVTYNASKVVHYLSAATTKRYWRLSVTDAGNSDSYIEIGEMILADYLEMSQMYTWGPGRNYNAISRVNQGSYRVKSKRFFNLQNALNYHWNKLNDTDITNLETMLEAITDKDTGEIDPVVWNPDTASPNVSYLAEFNGFAYSEIFDGHHTSDMALVEVLKSI